MSDPNQNSPSRPSLPSGNAPSVASNTSFAGVGARGGGGSGPPRPTSIDTRPVLSPQGNQGEQSERAHTGMSVPTDDEVRSFFQQLKQKYEELVFYVQEGRNARVQAVNENNGRISAIQTVFPSLPPAQQAEFQQILQDLVDRGIAMTNEISQLDSMVPNEKEWITNQLNWHSANMLEVLTSIIRDFHWPNVDVCRDLCLPQAIWSIISPSGSTSQPNYLQPDPVLQSLQALLSQVNLNASTPLSNARTTQVPLPVDNKTLDYRERRRRVPMPLFEPNKTSTYESHRAWLSRYEWYCEHVGFTEKERMEDLPGRLNDSPFNWYKELPKNCKQNWSEFIAAFTKKYSSGLSSTESAIQELKKFQKGNMPMHEFGTKLYDLLLRANQCVLEWQLDFLSARLPPELAQGLSHHDPATFEEAVKICSRLEGKLTKSGVALPTFSNFSNEISEQANQQISQGGHRGSGGSGGSGGPGGPGGSGGAGGSSRGMVCYNCGKVGHKKRNCFRLKKHKKKQYKNNSAQAVNQDKGSLEIDTDDTTPSIFSHFSNTALVGAKRTFRFYVKIRTLHNDEVPLKALIDTGSTLSTISRKLLDGLQLETTACAPVVIQYGNKSTQVSDEMALMKFKTDDFTSQVDLHVVEQQNEDLIFGMDWMDDEDIGLMAKTKRVVKLNTNNSQNHIGDDRAKMVRSLIDKFPNITAVTEQQPITNAPYEHRIDTGNSAPIASRDFRRPPAENDVINKEVEVMLRRGVVRPSSSSWCSPVVLVKKPDGSVRFCVDYRALNSVTKEDKYPIPRVSELIDRLHGSVYFTTIDLKSGYWHIPVAEEDRCKTAFIANGSLYEFVVLPFGVTNGPPTFQRFMKGVLARLSRTMVYLDDIILMGSTLEQHLEDLEIVLARLDKFNLKISPNKCQWIKNEVRFLGFFVGSSGIRADPKKTEAIKSWPLPGNIKSLQRFLGFCVFYHRFIKNLSTIAAPLYDLLKKDTQFIWTKDRLKAFDILKKTVSNLTTLAYPDPNAPYDLHTDASSVGIGAAIVQGGRPIAFASRSLTAAERNYSTTEQECLAVVWALNYFYCYVYGASLTIYTVHLALKAILTTKQPRGRLARWIMVLQNFRFTVVHKPGKFNLDADALSRKDQVNAQEIATLDAKGFKEYQKNDAIIASLVKGGVKKPLRWVNEILFHENVPVVPRSMTKSVLEFAHDGPLGGHFGVDKTLDKVKKTGWWPSMTEDVKLWVSSCEGCQRFKINSKTAVPPLQSVLPSYVGEIWAADIAILPTSKRGDSYILVFMEYLTKWAVTVALSSMDSSNVAQVLLFEIVLKFGVIRRLITDNGTNFVSDAFKIVCKRLNIARSLTSVEHPQTDGLVERYNRTLKEGLAIYVQEDALAWDEYLPFVTFAYNTAKHASTGYSPFKLLYGRDADIPLVTGLEGLQPKTYESEQWLTYLNTHLPALHSDAIEKIKKAQESQKKFYDKAGPMVYKYKVGDLVTRRNLEKLTFPKKRWSGPWIMLKPNNDEQTSWVIQRQGTTGPMNRTTCNIRHLRPWNVRDSLEEETM